MQIAVPAILILFFSAMISPSQFKAENVGKNNRFYVGHLFHVIKVKYLLSIGYMSRTFLRLMSGGNFA